MFSPRNPGEKSAPIGDNYNPKKNYLKAIDRRNWVIDRMFSNGFIKKEDLKYKNKPLEVFKRVDIEFSDADYFYEEIRKELFNKFGKEKLYSDGLIIKTALDCFLVLFLTSSGGKGAVYSGVSKLTAT